MKKSVLFLLFAVMAFTTMHAQDEGMKLAKKAGKDLVSYNIDPANNGAKLDEAKAKIDEALKLADAQAVASAWITKGDVYNTLTQKALTPRILKPDSPLPAENYALAAFEAYQKAYTLTDKKYEKKDAIKGIKELETNLNIFGFDAYDKKNFAGSYQAFQAGMAAYQILKDNGEESIFSKKESYDNQLFVTGLTAQLSGKNDECAKIYEQLYAAGTNQPAVYQGLYQMKSEAGKSDEALKILSEGRKKFPDDAGLLFDEINAYLKQGKLDLLIGNLKEAIAKEPNNTSLYVTMGNVYDNLYQKATTEKDAAKGAEYESQAKSYYNQALAKDPKNATAVYSIGAISFNKAAILTQEINNLANGEPTSANFSKIDKLGEEVKKLFNEALPYFQKAEALDPNDTNTLIALKEIFSRQDDLEKAKIFSERLKKVNEGGKNDSSYFKN